MIADMLVRAEVARCGVCGGVCGRRAEQRTPGSRGRDRKVVAGDAAIKTRQWCIQVHGGIGTRGSSTCSGTRSAPSSSTRSSAPSTTGPKWSQERCERAHDVDLTNDVSAARQFRSLSAKVRNWGRWGSDDQLGTLNFIDNAARRRASVCVQDGKAFSLSLPLSVDGPQLGGIAGRANPVLDVFMIAE